jgi:hypothetical protein
MGDALVGSDSALTKYELKRYYERVLPGIYVPKPRAPSLLDRTNAAWLWSERRGVIAGAGRGRFTWREVGRCHDAH